ncbi:MAG: NAD(+) diphosphatase [Thermodesulfobacteriota bacterium]
MQFIPADDFSANSFGVAWWFAFSGDRILITRPSPETVDIPRITHPEDLGLHTEQRQYLGRLDDRPCYAAALAENSTAPEGTAFQGLRSLYGNLDETVFAVAGLGLQLINWDKTHQYCGRCGGPTRNKTDERAKVCIECGLVNHPRISPAVIVAVIRDGRLLLAHAGRYPNQKLYSVIAGYVEPGENLEQAVRRELKEEVAIEVKNIQYFGSQPWPYSGSLMVGFTAEYAGGEVQEDGAEILHADWFTPENLPDIPGWGSIARQLIDGFVRTYSAGGTSGTSMQSQRQPDGSPTTDRRKGDPEK